MVLCFVKPTYCTTVTPWEAGAQLRHFMNIFLPLDAFFQHSRDRSNNTAEHLAENLTVHPAGKAACLVIN